MSGWVGDAHMGAAERVSGWGDWVGGRGCPHGRSGAGEWISGGWGGCLGGQAGSAAALQLPGEQLPGRLLRPFRSLAACTRHGYHSL